MTNDSSYILFIIYFGKRNIFIVAKASLPPFLIVFMNLCQHWIDFQPGTLDFENSGIQK